MRVGLIIYGSLDTLSGGYLYDRGSSNICAAAVTLSRSFRCRGAIMRGTLPTIFLAACGSVCVRHNLMRCCRMN